MSRIIAFCSRLVVCTGRHNTHTASNPRSVLSLLHLRIVGDAVNIASRIESATRAVGARFLISADTCSQVIEYVKEGRPASVPLPGKSVDYDLCEVIGLT